VVATAILITVIGFASCTKLDTTSQGADLLIIDNINTFADTLDVTTSQGLFLNDSTIIRKNENYVIGKVSNDPLFGVTDAAVYVQFKPTFYPFYFGNAGDTVKNGTTGNASPNAGFDSAFICFSYKGAWGDTSLATTFAQTFEVRPIIDNDFRDKTDTVRKLNYQLPSSSLGPVIGTASITPAKISAYATLNKGLFKDSVNNQIRIKLSGPTGGGFGATIFNGQDSVAGTPAGGNNAFYNDSIFRNRYNGFAITVTSPNGNTLFYVNLAEAKSRLEFHYHKTKNGVKDTVVQSFQMYPNAVSTALASSSSANYIKRTLPPLVTNNPASSNFLYFQTSPGTYADLSIPALSPGSPNATNRIVHRAYLIVEQAPSTSTLDDKYTPPPYLYLDLKDISNTVPQKYKPIYFDLSNQYYDPDATASPLYFPQRNIDFNVHGGGALRRYENGTGLEFYRYEFNITRYVQHIVSNGYYNYSLRLQSPYNLFYPQYTGAQLLIPFANPVALGRVKVGSGNGTNLSNPHRMKVVVIYSKI
jgi:hypothetical protein